MKAIVQTEYGSPDVLRLEAVDQPVPQDDEIQVRVRAASVDAGVWHLMRGTPFLIRLMFGGLRRPAIPILGGALAGEVEAVGSAVTQFKPGDAVFGDLSASGFGAFAEYVCAPASAFVSKPANVSFEAAATVPISGLAALQGLQTVGQLQSGQRVLVNGASGGVGSFAVQIAKALGADVTGVCGPGKVDMVRDLGADQVIDYTQADPTRPEQPYDLILDAAAYRPFFDFLPGLTAGGTYVMVGGSTPGFFQAMLIGPWISKIRDCQVKCLTSNPNQSDLLQLQHLLATGKIKPYLDRTYPLAAVPEAIRHLERRQVRGKVVISL
ncbi:alcohol dehydrogenase [filamentous cyanobacterium CCP5]|nr:alcohol dehydrogenase [filamentous cyanobacterium CCP5]